MKIEKKNKVAASAMTGPYVTVGSRGTTCPPFSNGIPEELVPNEWNELPPKVRWASDMPGQPLWRKCHSWVQSRKTSDGSVAKFFIGTLAEAIRRKLVRTFDNIEVERKLAGMESTQPKKSVGTLVVPFGWNFGQKLPFLCGFIPNKGEIWVGGRIEASAINENPPRNLIFVAKVNWPEHLLQKASKAAKSDEETPAPKEVPAKGKPAEKPAKAPAVKPDPKKGKK